MRHQIDVDRLGPAGPPMAQAVEGCVHCGFCLPACPTYQEMGEEMDSPRGRILLMKEVLEERLSFREAAPYIDRCLGCLACEPACPSGVGYHDLLHGYREVARRREPGTLAERLRRRLVHSVLPSPVAFRWALRGARLGARLAGLVPSSWRPLFDMARGLPWPLPAAAPLPAVQQASGRRRARVALLVGCAQEVLEPQITRSALRLLARCGVEVVVPAGQGCCGSLALHDGEVVRAVELATRNLAAFPTDVDAVLTTAAGCGSGIAEYPALFARQGRDPTAASAFAAKTRDVSDFLAELGMPEVPALARTLTLAYQGACHLEQAQGVRRQPRDLLRQVPNLRLVSLGDGERCCGSAGTYNLDQPRMADQLGRRKAEAVLASGAEAVATGNVGCLVQMRLHLDRLGASVPIYHTVEVLDRAFRKDLL
ncbi:MAG: heterodisulfide reductase-related iron-sulfur binding cluster [Acidobacteria bacterium]|nr:heterodisulfide reductase-related iron-sulfur binding cluster [Acidobacteriota bacterium]